VIEAPLRELHDLSEGWAFVRGRVGRRWLSNRGHDLQIVDLPHCWNAHDTFQPGLRSFSGHGAYRVASDFGGSRAKDSTGSATCGSKVPG